MGTGRQYDEKIKIEAVKLAREIGTKKAAEELDIPKNTLGGWVNKARKGEMDTGNGSRTPEESLNLAQQLQEERKKRTELSHRTGMLSLIEDAKAGKIQLILVKSIARFARNVVDCLSIVQELKNYGVGVCFDENNLCTLGAEGIMLLTILATVAEEELRSKSFIMNWSIQRRFQNGIFLIPELLGYDKDENGDLVINESEAETVKVIYYLYVNGWSTAEIADILTSYRQETKIGNTEFLLYHTANLFARFRLLIFRATA